LWKKWHRLKREILNRDNIAIKALPSETDFNLFLDRVIYEMYVSKYTETRKSPEKSVDNEDAKVFIPVNLFIILVVGVLSNRVEPVLNYVVDETPDRKLAAVPSRSDAKIAGVLARGKASDLDKYSKIDKYSEVHRKANEAKDDVARKSLNEAR